MERITLKEYARQSAEGALIFGYFNKWQNALQDCRDILNKRYGLYPDHQRKRAVFISLRDAHKDHRMYGHEFKEQHDRMLENYKLFRRSKVRLPENVIIA